MCVFAEDVGIPAQLNVAFGQVGASGHRWEQVDVGQHSAGVFPHLKADVGTLWNGDVAIDDGQVGTAFGIGRKLSLQYDLLSFHFTIDTVGNHEFLSGIMQRKMCRTAACHTEALGRIGAETVGVLSLQQSEGE